jgi:glycosyltransferase involved in cell wall biosynthesis
VPVGDPAALAARLGTLLDDPRMRADMGERARLRAQSEYSVEQTAARFQELVTGLAAR